MSTVEDATSITSSHTHVGGKSRPRELDVSRLAGPDQAAVPDEKIQETDDWEHSLSNPRNWPPLKKWTATSLVGIYSASLCLHSVESDRSPSIRSSVPLLAP